MWVFFCFGFFFVLGFILGGGGGGRQGLNVKKNYSRHFNVASFQADNLYLISKHYPLCYLSKPLNTKLTINALIISLLLFMENALNSACFCMTKSSYLFFNYFTFTFFTFLIFDQPEISLRQTVICYIISGYRVLQ